MHPHNLPPLARPFNRFGAWLVIILVGWVVALYGMLSVLVAAHLIRQALGIPEY